MFSTHLSEEGSEQQYDMQAWKRWAAREVHHRALIGHYLLEGQLTYLSGRSTYLTHASNSLRLSSSTTAFNAQSLQEWREAMETEKPGDLTFRQAYRGLFARPSRDTGADTDLKQITSPLDIRVILECLHALVRETRDSQPEDSIITHPTMLQIREALMRVHDLLYDESSSYRDDRTELLLVWHSICIDSFCDIGHFLDQASHHHGLDQHIFKSRSRGSKYADLLQWGKTSIDARRAFLHAAAAQDILDRLPVNRTRSFWNPGPIFTISLMYELFRSSGTTSILIPATIDWRFVLLSEHGSLEESSGINGDANHDASVFLTPVSGNAYRGPTSIRNLPFELKGLQASLHSLAVQWGVCVEMETILQLLDRSI
jgi:hypothetical protein